MEPPRETPKAVLQGHTSYVYTVAITHDKKYVVSGSGGGILSDNTVRVWNLQEKHQEAILYKNGRESIWVKNYPEIYLLINLL